jgi:hypothetical protein
MRICSSECFKIDHWNGWVRRKKDKFVARVGHRHYYIDDEKNTGGFRGFGGSKFIIKFNNGRIVETTNLWCQGIIPESFYDRLQDNAVFINEKELEQIKKANKEQVVFSGNNY